MLSLHSMPDVVAATPNSERGTFLLRASAPVMGDEISEHHTIYGQFGRRISHIKVRSPAGFWHELI